MKKLIGMLILIGLFCTGLIALGFEKSDPHAPALSTQEASEHASTVSISEAAEPASPTLMGEVLRAHMGKERTDVPQAFAAEALRLTSRPPGIPADLLRFFERRVSVVMAVNAYKRRIVDPQRQKEWFDLFDGSLFYHAVTEEGRLIEGVSQMTASQAHGFDFNVETFGLLPILKHLSDPAAKVVYLGPTAYGQHKFEVEAAPDKWTVYADAERLIRRVEVRNWVIEFGHYLPVDGFLLPFVQRSYTDGQLSQELIFTSITLSPELPSVYFSRETFLKEIAR
jgi:hypothetical protein